MTSTLPDTNFAGLVPGTWVIDPGHSEVGFTVRHLMSKVRGQFRDFEGSLLIAEDPFESSVSASIDLGSVDTRNEDRDNHLRSADFFSVETSPKMTFETTAISRKEWGVTFNIPLDGDKVMIGDQVNVVLAVEAIHQA